MNKKISEIITSPPILNPEGISRLAGEPDLRNIPTYFFVPQFGPSLSVTVQLIFESGRIGPSSKHIELFISECSTRLYMAEEKLTKKFAKNFSKICLSTIAGYSTMIIFVVCPTRECCLDIKLLIFELDQTAGGG